MPSIFGTSWGDTPTVLGDAGGVVTWSLNGAGEPLTLIALELGFSEDPDLGLNVERLLSQAFEIWSRAANIEFVRVEDPGGIAGLQDDVDIRIFFDDLLPTATPGQQLPAGLAFPVDDTQSPISGDILFNNRVFSDPFFPTIPTTNNVFLQLAIRLIGNAIGLGSDNTSNSVLNGLIDGSITSLTPDDIDAVQRVYGQQDNAAPVYDLSDSVSDVNLLESLNGLIVNGTASQNTIDGTASNERFFGFGGDDELVGRGGQDRLVGGGGRDTLLGGAGRDQLIGSFGDDELNGGAGNDILRGGGNNDRLSGSAGADRLDGDGGDDTLNGNAGSDILDGDDGRDMLFGGSGNDLLSGGSGDDTVQGGLGADTLNGNAGNDTLNGGEDVDLLNGGIDDDLLIGETARDTLNGGSGNDTLNGGAGSDLLNGGSDNDVLIGERGNDRLNGGAGSDTLDGGSQNDMLFGGVGRDVLNGGSGQDRLLGQGGNDTLDGGFGNDLLLGGAGSDVFVFEQNHGNDRIRGFDATDDGEQIDLSALDGFETFADVQSAATQGNGFVEIDTGSNSSITLENVVLGDLNEADFIL